MMKNILIVEDDQEASGKLKEALSGTHRLDLASSMEEAARKLAHVLPDLIILDHDLADGGGIESFRKIRKLAPFTKVIMISDSTDVQVAVSAVKLGAADFLKKPVDLSKLLRSVSSALDEIITGAFGARGAEIPSWLLGTGERVLRLLGEIEAASRSPSDIVIVGEKGISREDVAGLIHGLGVNSAREMACLDLGSFSGGAGEAHFWSTIQELLAERSGRVPHDEEIGEVAISGIDKADMHFSLSVLDFVRKRKSDTALGNINRSVRMMLLVEKGEFLVDFHSRSSLEGAAQVMIPSVRERKEDIPPLLNGYIRDASRKYGKRITAVSIDLLELLSMYDFPGNYDEMSSLVELAVLGAANGTLSMGDLPLDIGMFFENQVLKGVTGHGGSISDVRRSFGRELFDAVLDIFSGDMDKAASFLDVPRATIIESLGTQAPAAGRR